MYARFVILQLLWKQAWKLSAIKGEPNLSILWEKRQIPLKKAFSSQKVTSNFTQVFLDEKQFLQKSSFCRKAITAKKPFLAKKIDQVWSIFDRSDPKKIKNQTAISILSVSVTTFYNNIFWLVKIEFDQVWSSLDRSDPNKSKIKPSFVSFL